MPVTDLLYLALIVLCIALSRALVSFCERIVSRDS
jgi:hypothetical protein